MTDFNFEPKRILKHKNHVTLNEGDQYDAQVQHLEKRDDEFVELKKNEAAKKYGSKKLVRELDFNSRDGLKVEESGLENTPDWFPQVMPTIEWEKYRTLLYEIDHLWMNMFFVRELYGEERIGREQIIQLTRETEGLGLEVLCQLDYNTEKESFDKDEADGFIQVEIVEEEKENGQEYDVDVDFRHSYFDESEQHLASGLKEILTGIALKHGYEEQLVFKISKDGSTLEADIRGKDFTVRFDTEEWLDEDVSSWVLELLVQDGCPLNMEQVNA